MSPTAIFSAIVAVFKAIPVLDSWLQQFLSWYAQTQLASMKSENREALIKAVQTHDQRPIEHAIQSPVAGLPSGIPGTVIRPGKPGVHKEK